MPINNLQLQEFMGYFSGSVHSYGEHTYGNKDESGKRKGSSRTVTNKLITIEEYRNHLEGRKGLGVIPINENWKCKFGVIDIDIYEGVDLGVYLSAIEKNGFPLIPFKSKSGGLHLYMFLKEETPSMFVVDSLRKMSTLLSIDTLVKNVKNSMVEIFPKQVKLSKDNVGSWINLPYYNVEKTESYALRAEQQLTLNECLLYIKEKITTHLEITEFINNIPFNEAPPCLQLLNVLNPLGKNDGRNNYLFSFGVFLKKKDENFFEQNLQEINLSLNFPLEERELQKSVISSLKKKDYLYRCKESPCVDYCNKKECKEREFGIGKNAGYFSSIETGQLYQYKSFQPYYEWAVRSQGQEEFVRLRFKSEEEIIKQDTFLKLCMRHLYEIPSKLKESEWFIKVNQALKEIKIEVVAQDEDTSPILIVRNLIIDFLTNRAMAETKDQILAKRVYFDVSLNAYLFRVKDLNEYLYVQKQCKYFSPQELHGILREFKCTNAQIRTESKKQLRVSVFRQEYLEELTNLKDEIFTPDFSKYQDSDF